MDVHQHDGWRPSLERIDRAGPIGVNLNLQVLIGQHRADDRGVCRVVLGHKHKRPVRAARAPPAFDTPRRRRRGAVQQGGDVAGQNARAHRPPEKARAAGEHVRQLGRRRPLRRDDKGRRAALDIKAVRDPTVPRQAEDGERRRFTLLSDATAQRDDLRSQPLHLDASAFQRDGADTLQRPRRGPGAFEHREGCGETEGGPFIRRGCSAEIAVHQIGDMPADRQAKPGARLQHGGVGLLERLEDPLQVLFRDADAAVFNLKQQIDIFPHDLAAQPHDDLAARSKLDRVANQICRDLAYPPVIAPDQAGQAGVETKDELVILFLRFGRQQRDHILDGLDHIKWRWLDGQFSGLEF